MALAGLKNVPENERDFLRWGFSNNDGHVRIIQAIHDQFGIFLTTYILDPIPIDDARTWLQRHQTVHSDMNAILGIQGNDLSVVDFKKKDELRAWIDLHVQEHIQAQDILRI